MDLRTYDKLTGIGSIFGNKVVQDKYGEKFVYLTDEDFAYMTQEDELAIMSIVESSVDYKKDAYRLSFKAGTLYNSGYNL